MRIYWDRLVFNGQAGLGALPWKEKMEELVAGD
jgi:hypothetical protein